MTLAETLQIILVILTVATLFYTIGKDNGSNQKKHPSFPPTGRRLLLKP